MFKRCLSEAKHRFHIAGMTENFWARARSRSCVNWVLLLSIFVFKLRIIEADSSHSIHRMGYKLRIARKPQGYCYSGLSKFVGGNAAAYIQHTPITFDYNNHDNNKRHQQQNKTKTKYNNFDSDYFCCLAVYAPNSIDSIDLINASKVVIFRCMSYFFLLRLCHDRVSCALCSDCLVVLCFVVGVVTFLFFFVWTIFKKHHFFFCHCRSCFTKDLVFIFVYHRFFRSHFLLVLLLLLLFWPAPASIRKY